MLPQIGEHVLQNQERRAAARDDDEQPAGEQRDAARRGVGGAFGAGEMELGVEQFYELLWRWLGRSGFVHGLMNNSDVWFFPF